MNVKYVLDVFGRVKLNNERPVATIENGPVSFERLVVVTKVYRLVRSRKAYDINWLFPIISLLDHIRFLCGSVG
jgi:hypothetical protein